MKKLISLIIVFGFVIMLGAAGSADVAKMNFLSVLLFELLGIVVVLLGTSALLHYKRYLKRCAKAHMKKRRASQYRFSRVEKELC